MPTIKDQCRWMHGRMDTRGTKVVPCLYFSKVPVRSEWGPWRTLSYEMTLNEQHP